MRRGAEVEGRTRARFIVNYEWWLWVGVCEQDRGQAVGPACDLGPSWTGPGPVQSSMGRLVQPAVPAGLDKLTLASARAATSCL